MKGKGISMILVFLSYFAVIVISIILLLTILVVSSKIEIKISKLDIDNTRNRSTKDDRPKNNSKMVVQISLKIFNVHWIKIKLNKQKLASQYIKEKIKVEEKNIEVKNIIKDIKENVLKNRKERTKIIKQIKKTEVLLEKLDLGVKVGTEDVVLTSYLVGIISIIIANILPHLVQAKKQKSEQLRNNYKYEVMPVYRNKTLYKINLDCIISAKLVHIIYVIYLIKRSVDKNERTSNRESYEYSYE